MQNVKPTSLIVVNQYYKPDIASTGQLAADICESLVEKGFVVHVVTGQPSYSSKSPDAPEKETLNGVHVHRVDIGRFRGRESIKTRILGYLLFLWKARRAVSRLVKTYSFSWIMTFHNPPLVGMIGRHIAARRTGTRFLYVLQDIHPDILVVTRWIRLPSPFVWLWERLNKIIYNSADKIVVLSEGMREVIVEGKGVDTRKVHVIPIWGRPELSPDLETEGIRDELGVGCQDLLLLYSGNMGVMHPLEPILDAAAQLKGASVYFLFVGDGAKRGALVEKAEQENLTNTFFLPFQTEKRFKNIVVASDICLVALEPGLEKLCLPSKAFTFLSAGRPLLNCMAPSSDLAKTTQDAGCGWSISSVDDLVAKVRAMSANFDELADSKTRARKTYTEFFSRNRVIDEYSRLLSE